MADEELITRGRNTEENRTDDPRITCTDSLTEKLFCSFLEITWVYQIQPSIKALDKCSGDAINVFCITFVHENLFRTRLTIFVTFGED